MANQFLELIKLAAVEAVEGRDPLKLYFGEVKAEEPNLTIDVFTSPKITLTQDFIILCRNVTDYDFDMTVDHITEDADKPQTDMTSGGAYFPAFSAHLHKHKHKHPYKGRKTFHVHNKLLVGEKVLLFAIQNSGKFVVVDRVA